MVKIWEDTYYTASTDMEYTISTSGAVIFNGKAYARPDGGVKINISSICKNYLSNDLDSLSDGEHISDKAVRTFELRSEGVLLGSYEFIYDWSYDPVLTSVKSRPVNGHYATGQKMVESVYTTVYKNVISTVSAGGYCGRYALIYQNSYGGWDSFLIEGKVVKSDDYTSYATTRSYDNTTIEFGKKRNINEIISRWELHTSWLNDREAKILAENLFPSTSVYLQDMEENKIIPVVVRETSVEYKEYENELISYQIEIESSQIKERR